jgi:hypothetical protein
MEILFQTKEESNKKQLVDFLNLSKTERIYSFLDLILKVKQFPVNNKIENKNANFIIELKSK